MTARPLEIEERLQRQQERIEGGAGCDVQRLALTVLVDNVRSLWNVGSIFRTADACAVSELVLAGITATPPRPEITKTALGADEAVAWSYVAEPLDGLRRLRDGGFEPVALESTPQAVSLVELVWPRQVCLVVGNEVAGISAPVLEECERHVAIPMLGVKDSLNVAVAFGIAAHQAARALQASAGAGNRRRRA